MSKRPSIHYIPEDLQSETLYQTAAELIDIARSPTPEISITSEIDPRIRVMLDEYETIEAFQAYHNMFVKPALGTKSAMLYVLNLLNIEAKMIEWFEADFSLPSYKFVLDFEDYPESLNIDRLLDLIEAVKNERSRLAVIRQPEEFKDMLILDFGDLDNQYLSDVSGFNYRGVNIFLVQKRRRQLVPRKPVAPFGGLTTYHTQRIQFNYADWPLDNFNLDGNRHYSNLKFSRAGITSEQFIVRAVSVSRDREQTTPYNITLSDFGDLSDGLGFLMVFDAVEEGTFSLSDSLYLSRTRYVRELLPLGFNQRANQHLSAVFTPELDRWHTALYRSNIDRLAREDTFLDSMILSDSKSTGPWFARLASTRFERWVDSGYSYWNGTSNRRSGPPTSPEQFGLISETGTLSGRYALSERGVAPDSVVDLVNWYATGITPKVRILPRRSEIAVHSITMSESTLSGDSVFLQGRLDFVENELRDRNSPAVLGQLSGDYDLSQLPVYETYETGYVIDYSRSIDQTGLVPTVRGFQIHYKLEQCILVDPVVRLSRWAATSSSANIPRYGIGQATGTVDEYKVSVYSNHRSEPA